MGRRVLLLVWFMALAPAPGLFMAGPAGAASGGLSGVLHAQAAPDPSDRYRSFDTEHFRVVFGPGLEDVARRAALWAERGHAIMTEAFFPPPRGRIEILVVDHMDISNGFAMV
ncbi:MAG: hypothetical protein EA422_00700, partial [Gemmatimonadales bacterium]